MPRTLLVAAAALLSFAALGAVAVLETGARRRGYRPISLDLVKANSINRQPTSGNPANNAANPQDFRITETRLLLSVRTKLAQGLLAASSMGRDSLWFAYSQQSYWQLFNPAISRPFRSTDHELELIYVMPMQTAALNN